MRIEQEVKAMLRSRKLQDDLPAEEHVYSRIEAQNIVIVSILDPARKSAPAEFISLI
jgi:hypothetical protein